MLPDPKLQIINENSKIENSIIMFCLEDPFMKQTGYSQRVKQTINSLKDQNLYIIAFSESPDKNKDSVIELKKEPFGIKKILKGYGLSANQSFISERNLSKIDEIIKTVNPEYIIMEGFYFLGYFKLAVMRNCHVILDLHNYEVKRLKSSLETNISIKRRLLVLSGLLEYLYYQRKYDRYIWKYWITSSEEKEKFSRFFKIKQDKTIVIPNSVKSETSLPNDNTIERRCFESLLFIGNYSYPPNEEAAKIIIDELMPELSRYNKNMKCYLAGPDPPEWLRRRNSSNIITTGYVQNISDYYRSACIFIAPIVHGGGIKFKVIEALSYGLPIVGTKEALSGIDLSGTKYVKPVLIKDFSKRIISLIEDRDLYRNCMMEGYRIVKEQFSFEKIQKLINSSITRETAGKITR